MGTFSMLIEEPLCILVLSQQGQIHVPMPPSARVYLLESVCVSLSLLFVVFFSERQDFSQLIQFLTCNPKWQLHFDVAAY